MKKLKYCFYVIMFLSILSLLVGCGSTEPEHATINLKATTAIEPQYDNIQVLGKFVIAQKGNQSAIYSYDGTTYQLIAPLGTYVTEEFASNFSVGNTLSVFKEEPDPNTSNSDDKIVKNGLIDLQGNLVAPLHECISTNGIFSTSDFDRNFYEIQDYHEHVTSFYDGNGKLVAKTPNPLNDAVILLYKGDKFVTYRVPSNQANAITTNLYDKDGNALLPVAYNKLENFGDYLIAQSRNGSYGVIDWNGNTIIPFEFANLSNSDYQNKDNTWLIAQNKGSDSFYLMNIKGEKLLENCGYSRLKRLPDGNISVEKDGKSGVVTPENKTLIDFENYDLISIYSYNHKIFRSTLQTNIKNDSDTLTILDDDYQPTAAFNQYKVNMELPEFGLCVLQNSSNAMALFNLNGDQITPFEYEQIVPFNAPYLLGKKNHKYCFINSENPDIFLSGFDSMVFNKEIIQAIKNGKNYYYDYNCNPIQLEYDANTIDKFDLNKNDTYVENQDGTNNMIAVIQSNSGKKGVALIPSIK